ncbi:MAG TPA: cupredoxin family copper-binding protein [Steroidobacteraceae bacterium]|nr:cupredoxin family copper-binding protein [Steroidobacteraceae bacterium]
MRRRATRLLGHLGLATVCLLSVTASADSPSGVRVLIRDFMFSPMEVRTAVGSPVTWVNQDDEPHTVVSDTGLFRSGALDTGMAYTFTFDKPGTYHVICTIHPQMTATVIVE